MGLIGFCAVFHNNKNIIQNYINLIIKIFHYKAILNERAR